MDIYMNHTSMVNDPEYIHIRSQVIHCNSRILCEAETSTGIYVKWSLLRVEYTAYFTKEGGEWSVEFIKMPVLTPDRSETRGG